ncbi:MAG: hypothetical protein WBD05_03810 [Phycisphaerae bacterium]
MIVRRTVWGGLALLFAWVLAGCEKTAFIGPPPGDIRLHRSDAEQGVMTFQIEGDMSFTQAVTTIEKTGQRIVSISRNDAPIGVVGVGRYLQMPGPHTLKWSPGAHEEYELHGDTFVGIRADSPDQYDVAFVVRPSESVPSALQAYKATLVKLNQDSVFLDSKFRASGTIVWVCKIRYDASGKGVYADWHSPQP